MQVLKELTELQRERMALIKASTRLRNQACAEARNRLGWRRELPEKERNRINKLAQKLVAGIEDGNPAPEGCEAVIASITGFVLACQMAREPISAERKTVEKAMTERVHALPIWQWGESVRGLGPVNLAAIIGEAGDLSRFGNPAKLWSWFCAGMEADERQKQGSRRRRSVLWVAGESLIKLNGEGQYRQAYEQRRKRTTWTHPEWTKAHSHNDAHRIMTKQLLKHLWKVWNNGAAT